MSDEYRRLNAGEIIIAGDEVDACNDGWKDEPKWRPASCIGKPAPDPSFPSHRMYRRKIHGSNIESIDDHMARVCGCGCVRFNLLRIGSVECDNCGNKQKDLMWTDVKSS